VAKTKTASKRIIPTKTRAGGEWTEARFIGFLRSGLRQMSRRWAPIARQALDAVKRKNQSDNKRMKWEYQCCECGGWFARKNVEVDHIVPCGSFRSLEQLQGFVERLFVEPDGLCVRCEECHQVRTNEQRESALDVE